MGYYYLHHAGLYGGIHRTEADAWVAAAHRLTP